MPSTLTYPGVYIEEIPSGVRTISGVATSITAFVGYTARGPVNRAVRIFNFGDYEREFGGLHRDSDVSYAVQQFFMNGGGDAYVVRLAAGADPAVVEMRNTNNVVVLAVTANSAGAWGNALRVEVDYDTSNPFSTFNLTVVRINHVDGSEVEREQFLNLSMNSRSANYVVGVVNAGSRLVQVEREALTFADRGYSLGSIDATGLGPDATHNTITGLLNGSEPFEFTMLAPFSSGLNNLVTQLNTAIGAASLGDRLVALRTKADGSTTAPTSAHTHIMLRSIPKVGDASTDPEFSSVTVLPAAVNDASALLGLGAANGGREREGAASFRPAPGGTLGTDLALLTTTGGSVDVAIDDHGPGGTVALLTPAATIIPAIPNTTPVGPGLAALLQASIRGITNPAAQDVVVEFVGGALRAYLPGDKYPNAVISFSGANPANFGLPAAAGPTVNVQRYALGVGVNVGAQANAAPGSDGTPPTATEYLGSQAAKTGIWALRDVDLFNLLCLPGTPRLLVTQDVVVQAAIALCEEERAFMIIDPPAAATRTTVEAWAANLTKSRNAAVYFPWIQAADPLDNFRLRNMPPSGAVAGVFARTDATRGVWKAPAGTDATLNGTQGLAEVLTDMENGTLNPKGVNVLRSFPVYGRVVWGARTRAGADANTDEYKYVPVRRLALYIEETLFRNTQWVVFEPNDEPLWAQIRLNVGAFMNGLFRNGAFQGNTPAKAYLVKCDAETTTQYDIDRGIVNILVAFAPLKPAEFVVIKIQQKAQIPS